MHFYASLLQQNKQEKFELQLQLYEKFQNCVKTQVYKDENTTIRSYSIVYQLEQSDMSN